MEPRIIEKQRGLRMALRVAALSVGAGAALMALTASDATANEKPVAADAATNDGQTKPLEVTGWSCWGPVSRGPLAPPPEADDFLALLSEVPA